MKALLSTCLVLALFSPVASLICNSCFGMLGPCENPTRQECFSGEDNCVFFQMTNLMFPVFKFTFQSCIPSDICQKGSYTSGIQKDVEMQALMKCCDKGMCNKAPIMMPPTPKMVPNGLSCPGCYSLEAHSCQPNIMIPCKGDQTQCSDGAGSIKINRTIVPLSLPFAFQGCVSPNVCTAPVPMVFSNSGNELNLHRMKCSRAKFINSTQTDRILLGK